MSNEPREMTPAEYSQYLNARLHAKMSTINDMSGEEASMEEWKKLYQDQMNYVQEAYPNTFTKSVWERNYSKFYNPDNLRILAKLHKGSIESIKWSRDSDEFLNAIDQCRPIIIVADNDPNHILQILPPIFRSPRHLTSTDTGPSCIVEEDGSYMSNKELVAMVGDYFDQLSASDNKRQKHQARLLMYQCLQSVQDKAENVNDVKYTNAIIEEFNRRRLAMSPHATTDKIDESSINNDNDGSSIEDIGIVFED